MAPQCCCLFLVAMRRTIPAMFNAFPQFIVLVSALALSHGTLSQGVAATDSEAKNTPSQLKELAQEYCKNAKKDDPTTNVSAAMCREAYIRRHSRCVMLEKAKGNKAQSETLDKWLAGCSL